ncbi:sulfite exporter TauE/SafE family protein [Sulfitobacter sp. HNIBRBA2951]|uniref:sulfite exporter TauE/SafE family protein n=1 Tax=Sulfitobacter aquimarinus TaxID=3158557 RepID=UPI0032E02AB3
METFFPLMSLSELALAAAVGILAGFIKGVVGFGMPLIFISGLTVFMPPELALAGLIVPTLATNAQQALRQGVRAALESVRAFRVFLMVGGVAMVLCAQLVPLLPDRLMLAVIGVPVTFFAVLQLSGYSFRLSRRTPRSEAAAGIVAGSMGGLSGNWGAPTVAYLTALDTQKHDQMRIQGVIYGLGAVVLVLAHTTSGVLRAETIGFSVAMVPTAFMGMWVGMAVMDRIDQAAFRRATLFVLIAVGLNLIRRAVVG